MIRTVCIALWVALHFVALIPRASADEFIPATSPDVEIAGRSLVGPWVETGVGIGLTVASPVIFALVGIAAGPPLFECTGLWEEDYNDPEQTNCERDHAARQEQATLAAAFVAAPVGLVGLGLIAHGAFRVARIRRARARLSSAWLDVTPQVAVAPGQFFAGLHFTLR